MLLAGIIFIIAFVMTMTGRGGGNFYVITLALTGISMHQAATTGQFILIVSSLSASLFFGKKRTISWKLFFIIGIVTSIFAFLGGFFSDLITGRTLKYIFSALLFLSALLMLKPVKERTRKKSLLSWEIIFGDHIFLMDLKIALPATILSGFFAGMVGVSGGSFLVPLMVLACNVPMKIAVGTSTMMVSAIAFMGFLGHSASGHFDMRIALPLAVAGAIGGMLGSMKALKSRQRSLKLLFAITTLIASVIMIFNALMTK